MLIITCMDGALSWIRDRECRSRSYLSNIMHDVLCNLGYIYHTNIFEGKGGIWHYWDRRLAKFILDDERNIEENNLLLLGKSYGAWDSAAFLLKHFDDLHYKKIGFFSVDPHWLFRGKEEPLAVKADYTTNIFQQAGKMQGTTLMNVYAGEMNHYIERNSEFNLSDEKGINHFNIVTNNKVYNELRKMILTLSNANPRGI